MSYTVGLDFGTHQTKICIEDASNPAQKIYEFYEFDKPEGNKSVFLPSIVQINNDDTLSYGYVDENQCKTMPNSKSELPILKLPQKPIFSYSPKPTIIPKQPKPNKKPSTGSSLREQIQYQLNFNSIIEKWETECKIVDVKNKEINDLWELDCKAIENDYNYDIKEFEIEVERLTKRYNELLIQWELDNLPLKQIFRYFKLATFTNQFWEHNIKPEIISVWYLTFVLFKIKEKFGNDFYTQMGIPMNINKLESEKQKSIAFKILISANLLISEYECLEKYLNSKYTDLIQNTILFDYSKSDLDEYGLNLIPEAFAGLSSLTQQGRLTRGMHLLVDIGGGTTDIAFFTITENSLPNIHAVVSFSQGLNYIFEEYIKNNPIALFEAQHLFMNNQKIFNAAISAFHKQLESKTKSLIDRVENEFLNRKSFHKIEISKLRKAFENKPVVYCGGGSTYDSMRIPLNYFTDLRLITKDLLNIPYLRNKYIDDSMFTILATSYGLSIQLESEIELTLIENVFDHLPNKLSDDNNTGNWKSDYGLSDT